MPFVLGHGHLPRPVKRRKTATANDMAGGGGVDDFDPQASASARQDIALNIHRTPGQCYAQFELSQELKTSDRDELIQYIKNGQKPTWVPKPNLKALCDEEDALLQRAGPNDAHVGQGANQQPSAHIIEDPFFGPWTDGQKTTDKPRSVFHQADLDSLETGVAVANQSGDHALFTTSPTSVISTTPPPWIHDANASKIGRAIPGPYNPHIDHRGPLPRRRAPSLGSSLSSSFVMRTPTSPLVHTISNSSADFAPRLPTDQSVGLSDDKKLRRRTLPLNPSQLPATSSVESTPPNFSRPLPSSRPQPSTSFRGHQPRRSLSSFTYQSPSNFSAPYPRERRPSLALELSSRHKSSMVGSFEESILRGRMSSPASKTFDFVAQVGVMGKGDCPASLRCPAHVSVPFGAVFYQYSASSDARSISDDAPTPYVGTIDLEHNLKPVKLSVKQRNASTAANAPVLQSDDPRALENTPIGKALARDMQKRNAALELPKIVLGGAYRVPQKGQLQILIKNQNKTAVKLFLVPYDLEGMEAGTKTFVRQRSFSSGPIFEPALGSHTAKNLVQDPLKDKRILRYLIHLKFCCPAKGRFYLHENIRVVFANRVPDGKEKLDSELQLPEPRFSVWRATPESRSLSQSSTADLSPLHTKSSEQQSFPKNIACIIPAHHNHFGASDFLDNANMRPSATIPIHTAQKAELSFSLSPPPTGKNPDAPTTDVDTFFFRDLVPQTSKSPVKDRALSPVQGFLPSTSARASPVPWGASSTITNRSFSPVPVEAGDGLLSRQFRTLNSSPGDSPPKDRKTDKLSQFDPTAMSPARIDISTTISPNTKPAT